MKSYAFYRMPHADHYYEVRQNEGSPQVLSSYGELGRQQGFVIAPFSVSDDCPIVVIEGESSSRPLETVSSRLAASKFSCNDEVFAKNRGATSSYKESFNVFHEALLQEQFRKLVLSRCERVETEGSFDAETLFFEACRRYPRMFVTLFNTPQTGMWLMATPEILLEAKDCDAEQRRFATMALAGTMRLEGELLRFDNPDRSSVQDIRWSQKNIQEQRLVATYIAEALKRFSDEMIEKGPYTTRAANLVHLRSDFSFVPKVGIGIGDMVEALHPTPAVCGLPKEEARLFILEHEPTPRRYYSGFCGPLNNDGVTRLFVSLRCMEIRPECCLLYAGGGLLADSVEEQEWQETEAKMQTMKGLFRVEN